MEKFWVNFLSCTYLLWNLALLFSFLPSVTQVHSHLWIVKWWRINTFDPQVIPTDTIRDRQQYCGISWVNTGSVSCNMSEMSRCIALVIGNVNIFLCLQMCTLMCEKGVFEEIHVCRTICYQLHLLVFDYFHAWIISEVFLFITCAQWKRVMCQLSSVF